MAQQLLSIWFPRLASDASLQARPVEGSFALTLRSRASDSLNCLIPAASARGLASPDAPAICLDPVQWLGPGNIRSSGCSSRHKSRVCSAGAPEADLHE
jgi:protein ImuB